jgi:hypothetical protein
MKTENRIFRVKTQHRIENQNSGPDAHSLVFD